MRPDAIPNAVAPHRNSRSALWVPVFRYFHALDSLIGCTFADARVPYEAHRRIMWLLSSRASQSYRLDVSHFHRTGSPSWLVGLTQRAGPELIRSVELGCEVVSAVVCSDRGSNRSAAELIQ